MATNHKFVVIDVVVIPERDVVGGGQIVKGVIDVVPIERAVVVGDVFFGGAGIVGRGAVAIHYFEIDVRFAGDIPRAAARSSREFGEF